MWTAVKQGARLLVGYGPILVALYLTGGLLQYVGVQAFGWVGAHNAVIGGLLFPFIMLARLVPLVLMFLVLRPGLEQLGAIAPLPADARGRRASFRAALLVAIVPFVVFYAGSGMLREDWNGYQAHVLFVTSGLHAQQLVVDLGIEGAEAVEFDGAAGELTLSVLTGGIIAAAFLLRWLYGKYKEKLPRVTALGAAYLEALWTVWTVLVIGGTVASVQEWVASRRASVWLADTGAWFEQFAAPLAWAWGGLNALLAGVGAVILAPIAWLTIAGVIYGEAVKATSFRLAGARVDGVRARFSRIPAWARKRVMDLGGATTGRVRSIWNALVLAWRSGPVLLGAYVFAFALVLLLSSLADIAATRIVGPHPLDGTWQAFAPILFLLTAALVEPIRVVVVATAYDAAIGRLRDQADVEIALKARARS